NFREVKLPVGRVVNLDDRVAEVAENLEIDARVAAHFGDGANEERRHVDTALQQRPRDDESVAAVVAAAAEHGDFELADLGKHGLDRGDDLAAGVLHQYDRWDADVLDGPPIGVPHLRAVQNPHGRLAV